MRTMTAPAAALLALSLTGLGCAAPAPPNPPKVAAQEPLVVFLVRHGEKVDQSQDAALSDAGRERATELAHVLRSAEIEHVHSSDYTRTRDTAAPTATRFGLELELYDPRELPALANELRSVGGRHLVVGHSNTTPQLAEQLGGSAGAAIDEATEYDRIYVVSTGPDGSTTSILMRYGAGGSP